MSTRSPRLHHDTVHCSDISISYSYCHARRRTLGITVYPDRRVAVRVPLATPLSEIRSFVQRRCDWILKVWGQLEQRPRPQAQAYTQGSTLLFQGRPYHLDIISAPTESVQLHDDTLQVSTILAVSQTQVASLINRWYQQQALEIFRERAMACHRTMLEERIPLPPLRIRSMKSRWGSYSYRTRHITLNLALIRAPQACLDYVIIHELCHIKVRHHGPEFWQLVARYVPDHKQIRRQLMGFI